MSQNNDDTAAALPGSRSSMTDEEVDTCPSYHERSQLTPRVVLMVTLTALTLLGTLYLLWELREIIRWCAVASYYSTILGH